ncbi:MAG: class I SAM-dependent methyltransferase [Gammaproteobacteria bacterium]|nr:class I SAM-dependent methyltransferase [Gammaproteobacteria bacterium]
MNKYELIKNKYGYYEISNKPTADDLAEYYTKKYYQNGQGEYDAAGKYTDEEVLYFHNKIEQKYIASIEVCPDLLKSNKAFLDIGAGEGWALSYFSKKGWQCLGMDFSDYGCANNNPDQITNLLLGDIYSNLLSLCENQRKFDIVLIDNVLEHVIDPLQVLKNIRSLVAENGVLIIEVPNDFSVIQNELFEKKYVADRYWVAYPDHLSYFNKQGLQSLVADAGWKVKKIFSAYPIDFNLFNENTNYIVNRDVGKSCHHSRVAIENILHSVSVEKTIKLYEAMAEMGLGRDIIMIMS